MKNFLYAAVCLCFIAVQNSYACDYCMCSYGVSPLQPNSILIGLDYRYLDIGTLVNGSTVVPNTFNQKEVFSTMRLNGIIPIFSNATLIVNLPFTAHSETATQNAASQAAGIGPNESAQGLGDMTVLLSYRMWQELGDGTHESWHYSAALSLGGKLPTGYVDAKNADGNYFDPDVEGGTGTLDPMANFTFLAGSGDWGFSANLFDWYPLRGGPQDYQYGNSFTYEGNAIYHVMPETFTSPNLFVGLGIGGEDHGIENQGGVPQPGTGGNALYFAPNVRVTFDRFVVNMRVQDFFYHNDNVAGAEELDYSYRIMAGVQYQL